MSNITKHDTVRVDGADEVQVYINGEIERRVGPDVLEDESVVVEINDSHTFPEGPSITICHADDGAYVHVEGDDE
jgi:hypothetical protein